MPLALFLAAIASAATPFLGVEWRPLSRADLNWIDDGRSSGLTVGEFDGTASPNLTAYGGLWFTDRFGLSASLGVARLQNTTEIAEVTTQRHWGVIRPAIDARFALTRPQDRRPLPWMFVGVHGDIPSVRDVSNGYTEEEQTTADENATTERARLGGVGCRAGIAAEYSLLPAVTVGLQYALVWHRSVFQADDRDAVTSLLSGEASFLMAFQWPAKERD